MPTCSVRRSVWCGLITSWAIFWSGCSDGETRVGAPRAIFGVADTVQISQPWMARQELAEGAYLAQPLRLPDGGFAALDERTWQIFRISPTGEKGPSVGQKGEGPGDLGRPCCIAVARGPEPRVWVYEISNHRYSLFDLSGSTPRYISSTAGPSNWARLGRVVQLEDGTLLHPELVPNPASTSQLLVVSRIDSNGRVTQSDTLPLPRNGRADVAAVTQSLGAGRGTSIWIVQPFGSVQLSAMGKGGATAQAYSGFYRIDYRAPNGQLKELGDSKAKGPELTKKEKDEAQKSLEEQAKSAGTTVARLPFGVPAHKAPIAGLEFDAGGRLWVRLSVPEGAQQMADVYDSNANVIGRYVWPEQLNLVLATGASNEFWAWSQDSAGFKHYVLVRFSAATK